MALITICCSRQYSHVGERLEGPLGLELELTTANTLVCFLPALSCFFCVYFAHAAGTAPRQDGAGSGNPCSRPRGLEAAISTFLLDRGSGSDYFPSSLTHSRILSSSVHRSSLFPASPRTPCSVACLGGIFQRVLLDALEARAPLCCLHCSGRDPRPHSPSPGDQVAAGGRQGSGSEGPSARRAESEPSLRVGVGSAPGPARRLPVPPGIGSAQGSLRAGVPYSRAAARRGSPSSPSGGENLSDLQAPQSSLAVLLQRVLARREEAARPRSSSPRGIRAGPRHRTPAAGPLRPALRGGRSASLLACLMRARRGRRYRAACRRGGAHARASAFQPAAAAPGQGA
nr:uncharacterized protein LOC123285431 [Equus asinus]